jgi:hypothetical protein
MFRRRRQFEAAREAYEAAFRSGDNSFALHRDYADCLHRLGRLKEATAQIRSILNRQTENIFVLDLALRIYIDGIKSGEDVGMPPAEVQRYLADLDRFDVDRRFIHHSVQPCLQRRRSGSAHSKQPTLHAPQTRMLSRRTRCELTS